MGRNGIISVEKRISTVLILLLVIWSGCNRKGFYVESDFLKLHKIDAHCHINTKDSVFMGQVVKDNFTILTINTDAPSLVGIREQRDIAISHRNVFPGHIEYLTTFSMKRWGNKEWLNNTIEYIEESLHKDALGVKIWKNIGMTEKAGDSSFVLIDDPGFDPLFDYLEKNNIPICGHLGEPKNCWLPVEEMTVNNDKDYYKKHPQYHMFLHPEYPSYEKQIEARDHMLEKHPDLKFMGAHLGSLEWSVDELGRFLDNFPNASVDMAARICHLELQAQKDWQKVRDFMIRYQDRIIYATDMGDFLGTAEEPEKLIATIHKTWLSDWEFLATDKLMSVDEVNGEFRGINLPRTVVDKIYYKNAEKMFPGIKSLKGSDNIAQGKRSTTLGYNATTYESQSAMGLKNKSNHAT